MCLLEVAIAEIATATSEVGSAAKKGQEGHKIRQKKLALYRPVNYHSVMKYVRDTKRKPSLAAASPLQRSGTSQLALLTAVASCLSFFLPIRYTDQSTLQVQKSSIISE